MAHSRACDRGPGISRERVIGGEEQELVGRTFLKPSDTVFSSSQGRTAPEAIETPSRYLRMAEQNSPQQFAQQEVTMRARSKTIRALLIAGVAVCAIATPLANIGVMPAAAQAVSVSAEFCPPLQPHGAWPHPARWGEGWIPSRV